MKTKQDLTLEVSILKDRLDKAVVFEVTEDIIIGMSEADGLFRIRHTKPTGQLCFLNKNYQWEEQPKYVDLAYSERTGYYTAEEAFEVFEFIQDLNASLIYPQNILKNN